MIRTEEEGPVLRYRTSNRRTELILPEWSHSAEERIAGVQRVVTQELPGRPVYFVRAGLRHHVDHATDSAAEFGLVIVGLDLEFLNCVHDWSDGHRC